MCGDLSGQWLILISERELSYTDGVSHISYTTSLIITLMHNDNTKKSITKLVWVVTMWVVTPLLPRTLMPSFHW